MRSSSCFRTRVRGHRMRPHEGAQAVSTVPMLIPPPDLSLPQLLQRGPMSKPAAGGGLLDVFFEMGARIELETATA